LENSAVTNDASGNAWSRFWFAPIPTTGFTVLRVLSGLLFAFWLLSFLGHQDGFFSLAGFLDLKGFGAAQRQQEALPAPIDWSILYIAGQNTALFHALYWGAIAVFLLFALGIATRITGVLTWVFVVSFLANPATSYEGDYLLAILAFYMMLGHVLLHQCSNISIPERILGSWDQFLASRRESTPSVAANWTLRLMQIHFVIIMMTSGFHKLQMGDWWSGAALWYPLHPTLRNTMESVLTEKPSAYTTLFWVSLVSYGILAWQIALPVFAWRTGIVSRVILLGGALLGWFGMMYWFQLPLFGPFIMINCLGFVSPEEWSSLRARVLTLVASRVESKAVAKPVKQAVK
jgi:hypothetical protein